ATPVLDRTVEKFPTPVDGNPADQTSTQAVEKPVEESPAPQAQVERSATPVAPVVSTPIEPLPVEKSVESEKTSSPPKSLPIIDKVGFCENFSPAKSTLDAADITSNYESSESNKLREGSSEQEESHPVERSPTPAPVSQKDQTILEQTINERSEEHTSELQSRENLVCRLLLEKKK